MLLVPVASAAPDSGVGHDALVLVGLLALARFAVAAAAWDVANGFALMGASRDLTIAVFVEATLVLALAVAALVAGTTDLARDGRRARPGPSVWSSPALALAAVAFALVVVAETGRQPIDNPDTHLELTMIHEGPLLEYAGRDLALLQWAAAARHWLVLVLAAQVFLPHPDGVCGCSSRCCRSCSSSLCARARADRDARREDADPARAAAARASAAAVGAARRSSPWLVEARMSGAARLAARRARPRRRRSSAGARSRSRSSPRRRSLLAGDRARTTRRAADDVAAALALARPRRRARRAVPARRLAARASRGRCAPDVAPLVARRRRGRARARADVARAGARARAAHVRARRARARRLRRRRPSRLAGRRSSRCSGSCCVENGLALAALELPGGSSLAIELGVALDLTLVALVAAVFHERIFAEFGTGDTAVLRSLRD